MNFLAGALIVVACTYLGFGIDNYYKVKVSLIKDFLSFINFAFAEINYLKTNILELIKKYDQLYPSRLSKALLRLENPITAKAEELTLYCLSDKEKSLILSFIQDISRLDMSGQKAYIESTRHKVNKITEEMEKQRKTKGNLAKKLAPLLGLGIMIVII